MSARYPGAINNRGRIGAVRLGLNFASRPRGGGGGSVPGAVTNLQAYAFSDTEVQLFYTPAPGATEHRYNLSSSEGLTYANLLSSDGVIDGLVQGVIYTITLYGVNANGNSAETAVATATTYYRWRLDYEVLNGGVTAARVFHFMDNGSEVTLNGSLVSAWADKSSHAANVIQATSGNQPPYNATSRNGRPAIELDGVSDILSSSTVIGNPAGQAAISVIYAVYGETDLAAFRYFVNFNGSATFQLGSGGSGFPRYQAAAGNMSNSGLSLIGNDVIASFKCPAGASVPGKIAINGGAPVTATISRAASTHTSFSIGGPNAHVRIGAVYVLDGEVDDVDEAYIVGSLAWERNIVASLPSDHLFKLAPPYSSHETAYQAAVTLQDITYLVDWFKTYSGPTVAITDTIIGYVEVNSQTDADALIGKKIIGWIYVSASVWLHDFIIEFDETEADGEPLAMIHCAAGATGTWINNIRIDGMNSKLSIGIGGVSYAEGITVEFCEIIRCGYDSLRQHKNSDYRYNYIHNSRPWDEDVDGPYDGNGNQTLYQHNDGIQGARTGNTIERNYVVVNMSASATGALMITTEPDLEAIDSLFIDKNVFGGANNYTVHIVEQDFPINAVTLTNNIFMREFGGNVTHPNDPIADGSLGVGVLTASGNLWADDFTAISGY